MGGWKRIVLIAAVAFAATTLIAAALMLAHADTRLLIPLVAWFVGYITLMRWNSSLHCATTP